MPAPHHSIFLQDGFLMPNQQPTVSVVKALKAGKQSKSHQYLCTYITIKKHINRDSISIQMWCLCL